MSPHSSASTLPVHRIEPSRRWVPLDVRELWEARELLQLLVWREVNVRYKQTLLGVAWAVLQPLLTMVVFSVFFGRLGGLSSDGLPYPLFTYVALLPWQLFAFSMTETSNSLVNQQRLLTKVYFPRLVLPLASIAVGLIDFTVSLAMLVVMLAYYHVTPTAAAWTLPLWALLASVAALSVGLWLSSLNVRYRDVRYTLPFLTQLWLFATPVAYSSSIVPQEWRWLYALNPMVGVVEGFRWALLGHAAPGASVAVSAGAVAVLGIGGLFYFRKTERSLADVI